MLERDIEKKSAEAATDKGWYTFKVLSNLHKGLPDRCFIKGGHVVFIEYKKEDGKLSALQERTHRKFADHGITVYVCRSVAETMGVLDAIA